MQIRRIITQRQQRARQAPFGFQAAQEPLFYCPAVHESPYQQPLLRQALVHAYDLHLVASHLRCLLHGASARCIQLERHVRQRELPNLHGGSISMCSEI